MSDLPNDQHEPVSDPSSNKEVAPAGTADRPNGTSGNEAQIANLRESVRVMPDATAVSDADEDAELAGFFDEAFAKPDEPKKSEGQDDARPSYPVPIFSTSSREKLKKLNVTMPEPDEVGWGDQDAWDKASVQGVDTAQTATEETDSAAREQSIDTATATTASPADGENTKPGEDSSSAEQEDAPPPRKYRPYSPPAPKLRAHIASVLQPREPDDGRLGKFLARDVTVLVGAAGSNASGLALAIAEALATGEEILGQRCEPMRVLYLDTVRPLDAVTAALAHRSKSLRNLYILAREDFFGEEKVTETAEGELQTLAALGQLPDIIVVNPLDRFSVAKYGKKRLFYEPAGATQLFGGKYRRIPRLVVVPASKSKIAGLQSVPAKTAALIEDASSVLLFQRDGLERRRLTHFVYGEEMADLAVEAGGNWSLLGNADEQVRGSRQDRVFAELKEAGKDGLPSNELAALVGITTNNLYQAIKELKKSDKVVVKNKKYYAKGFDPGPEQAKKT